ncbi:DEAD/DEAH box helicase [Atopobium fossor]|uniref:DEAD/DEAH box helicase n=1 Tax=Atopobium fossor TaxID=39487 RepID=UPI0004104716|nr:DEAD/DEAH box helicase [Atopobium fossor]
MNGRDSSNDNALSGERLIRRKFQYAKAKAKLVEFSTPREEYPEFKFDSDDLCFNAMHALSSYVDVLLHSEVPDEDTQRKLKEAASFYDAASIEEDHSQFSDGFWLLAMASYFLLENFGSAAVASERVHNSHYYGEMGARFYFLVNYLLKGASPNEELRLSKLISYIEGDRIPLNSVQEEAATLLNIDSPESYLFGKVCYVAIGIVTNFAASRWLPEFSGLDKARWSSYLKSDSACRLLWQSQKSIGQAGAFKGKSLFVQMPTGSGKTRSIQLLIRSRVLAGKCKQAVVMAPLRALCSEIARDLEKSLSDIVEVRQAADTLELDTWLGIPSTKPRVLVFTPEKFAYVERHEGGLIVSTELFILDEAHLVDDSSRGASYELTIAEIKQKNPDSQLVMLSAVVQNPEEIADWAMGDSKSCISNNDIPKTEKSLGVIDKGYHLNFWDLDMLGKSEYFVPLKPKVQVLDSIGRESKNRHFPALENEDNDAVSSRELALYMAEQVIPTGPVAMYLPQTRFISAYFSRLHELIRHGCKLPRLAASCNSDEGQRISKLVDMHYGSTQGNNIFHDGILAGILPHYGNLQGCLRQVVEDELERGNFKCVACTSTLAQGINLPIKYLIITAVENGISTVKTRDFQNLLGRVARSGKYSEGSVLISDPSILSLYGAQNYGRLLDDRQSEACVSAIAKLFNDLPVKRAGVTLTVIPGNDVVNMMLEGLAHRDASSLLIDILVEIGLNISEARRCIASRLISFAAIETYVAGMLEQKPDDVNAVSLSVSTFAYASADDAMKELLLKLFQAICETLEDQAQSLPVSIYSKTQMGVAKTELLKQWLQSADGDAFLAAEDNRHRLSLICKAYRYCMGDGDEWFDDAVLSDLANMWMCGRTINGMCNELKSYHTFQPRKGPNVHRVESALSDDISYGLANFISCIADLLEPVLGDSAPVNLKESLFLLHEKVKFGVSMPLGCVISQEIFADRMVVRDLVEILGFAEEKSSDFLRMLIIHHKKEVESYLSNLPAYFTNRYEAWMQNE